MFPRGSTATECRRRVALGGRDKYIQTERAREATATWGEREKGREKERADETQRESEHYSSER